MLRSVHSSLHGLQGALLRYLSSSPWAPERHASWPTSFRAAAATLLLCARHGGGGAAAAEAGPWSLPESIMLHILELLAGRRVEWLGERGAG